MLIFIWRIEDNEAGFSRSGERSRTAGSGPHFGYRAPRTPALSQAPYAAVGLRQCRDSLCPMSRSARGTYRSPYSEVKKCRTMPLELVIGSDWMPQVQISLTAVVDSIVGLAIL